MLDLHLTVIDAAKLWRLERRYALKSCWFKTGNELVGTETKVLTAHSKLIHK